MNERCHSKSLVVFRNKLSKNSIIYPIISIQNINKMILKWIMLLSLIIPLRERRVSDKFTLWLTSDIKCMSRTRDKLKAAAIKAKSTILMEACKRIRNKATVLNTQLKKQYCSMKTPTCEGNLKDTWATIDKLIDNDMKLQASRR